MTINDCLAKEFTASFTCAKIVCKSCAKIAKVFEFIAINVKIIVSVIEFFFNKKNLTSRIIFLLTIVLLFIILWNFKIGRGF